MLNMRILKPVFLLVILQKFLLKGVHSPGGMVDCIFERLDRILVNQEMQEKFNLTEVEHLSRTGSDHAPMFFTCEDRLSRHKKPFRFLKFWTENPSFIEVVRQNWCSNGAQNPFLEFKANIKNVKSALTKWSKDTHY